MLPGPRYTERQEWFNNPGDIEQHMGLWVLKSGLHPSFHNRSGPRFVEFYSLHFVARGRVRLYSDQRLTELMEGDAFCLFPGSVYVYEGLPDNPPAYLAWVAFLGPQALPLLAQAGFTPERNTVKQALSGVTLPAIAAIQQLVQEAHREHAISLTHKAFELLDSLNVPRQETEERPSPDADLPHWLTRVADYMALHYSENLSVSHLADWAGVHRSHLTRVFIGQYGMSPSRYLLTLQMKQATRLMAATPRASITQIAYSLGFADLYAFSRAFTRFYGESPRKRLMRLHEKSI